MAEQKKVSKEAKEGKKSSSAKALEDKGKASKEEAKDDKKKAVEVPKKFKEIVGEIEKMSVLDLAELVKILEDKFGVSAAVSAAVTEVPAVANEGAEGGGEEKSAYNIKLTAAGDAKINVIKAVKEITEVGLKDAKDLVDGAPKVLKENVPKEEAEEMKKKLEETGATVELE